MIVLHFAAAGDMIYRSDFRLVMQIISQSCIWRFKEMITADWLCILYKLATELSGRLYSGKKVRRQLFLRDSRLLLFGGVSNDKTKISQCLVKH